MTLLPEPVVLEADTTKVIALVALEVPMSFPLPSTPTGYSSNADSVSSQDDDPALGPSRRRGPLLRGSVPLMVIIRHRILSFGNVDKNERISCSFVHVDGRPGASLITYHHLCIYLKAAAFSSSLTPLAASLRSAGSTVFRIRESRHDWPKNLPSS